VPKRNLQAPQRCTMSLAADIHPGDSTGDTRYPSRTRRNVRPASEESRLHAGEDGYAWVTLASDKDPSDPSAIGSYKPPAIAAAADQISELRMKLEEKEFALLDAQSDNVKALTKLRGLVDLRDKTIKDLKTEISHLKQELLKSQNQSMASAMDVEAELVRSKEQITILRMRLEDAKDRNAELASTSTNNALSSRVKEMEAENVSLVHELTATKDTLLRKSMNLASKEAELAEVRCSVSEQHSKIRALHEQLASFVSQDATDTARVEVSMSRFQLAYMHQGGT
jgi:chromosome segregation ATPase